MKLKSQQQIWIQSFVYVTLISLCLYSVQTLFSSKFLLTDLNNTIIIRKKQPSLPLRFRSDGTFKILQVADMHYGNGITTRCRDVLATEFDYCSDLNTTRFLKRMIEAEKPDFIAFTGDNIFGSSASDAAESLFEVFGPVIESRLPWAAVLGNHDQESTMTREELMSFISLMDYSLSQPNPSAGYTDEHPPTHIDGFGNYHLQVFGALGSPLANSSVLNLYFLDSGDRAVVDGIRTYGWIKESQLLWLRGVSKKLQEQHRLVKILTKSTHDSFFLRRPEMTFRPSFSLLSKLILRRRQLPLKTPIFLHSTSITPTSSSPFLYTHSPNYTYTFSHSFSTNHQPDPDPDPVSTRPNVSDPRFDSEFVNAVDEPDPYPDPVSTRPELADPGFDSEVLNTVANVVTEQDSIFPIRALISLLDGYHDFSGFSWWVIISSSVFAFRIAMFPVILYQLSMLKEISMLLPKLPPPFPRPFSGKSYVEQFKHFRKERKAIGCPSLVWHIVPVVIQMPCFILGVTTIRRMALNHHPGFDSGGVLWFHDLTQMPYGVWGAVFPVLVAGLHVTNVALTFSKISISEWPDRMRVMLRGYKFFLDGLVLPILFVGFFIPQGGSVYWVANSVSTLVQHLFIGNASVRNYFGLPVKDGPVKRLAENENTQVDDVLGGNLVDTIAKHPKKVSAKDLSPKELVNLSIQMLAKGDKQKAVPLLRLALNKDPEHIRSLIVLGQTLLQDGLLAEAVEKLERAVSNILLTGPPSKVEEIDQLILASMWCGVAYIRNGRNAEGVPHLERIGHMNEPADAKSKAHYYDGLLMLASALLNEGRKPEAEKYLQRAVAYSSAYNVYLEQLQNEDDHIVSDLVHNKRKDQ